MGGSGHPSREQTLIFVIGCFIKPSGCVGAAARQPSRLGTKTVPSRSRIYDRRPFSHQKEILLANKGESIYDKSELRIVMVGTDPSREALRMIR